MRIVLLPIYTLTREISLWCNRPLPFKIGSAVAFANHWFVNCMWSSLSLDGDLWAPRTCFCYVETGHGKCSLVWHQQRTAEQTANNPELCSSPDRNAGCCENILLFLLHLHWLPVRQRMKYSIFLPVCHAVNGLLRLDTQQDFWKTIMATASTRTLDSGTVGLRVVPGTHTRSSHRAAAHLWNPLPVSVRKSDLLTLNHL